MKLFSDEIINITNIHAVNRYVKEVPDGETVCSSYSVKLPTYELIFFINADADTTFSGVTVHDCSDCIRYLPKGRTDGGYTVLSRGDSDCIDIYFDTDSDMPEIVLTIEKIAELKPLFLKVYNIWSQKRAGYYTEAMSVMYGIIRKIKSHGDKYLPNSAKKRLEPAIEYIHSRYTSPNLSYTAACNMTDLSYSYFKELFIKAYGTTPVKYVCSLRIEKAKELLITGRYSVGETADQCGFRNVYYFSAVFKKAVGVPPSAYKDNIAL